MSYLNDFLDFIKNLFGNGKVDTMLTSKEFDETMNAKEKYYVVLTDTSRKPLVGETVSFTINGKTYDMKTDKDGVAGLEINLRTGIYQCTTWFRGNDQFNSCKNFENVIVNADIVTTDLNMTYKDGSQFVARLNDKNKASIGSAKVTFSINGRSYDKYTDNKGEARLDINLNPGEYTIKTVCGNKSKTNKIVIGKMDTWIDAPNISMAHSDGSTFNAAIYSPKERLYLPLVFSIAGTDWTYTPREDGICSSKEVNALNPGEYDIRVRFDGNHLYKPSSTTGHLVVYKPEKKYTGDTTGYYLNPRYLGEDTYDIIQVTDYSCACNSGQQDHFKLTGVVENEYDIIDYMGTGTNGTGHSGIEAGIKRLAKNVGRTAKMTWYNFSELGWEEVGRLTEDPSKAILCHNLYRNQWGHYEVFKAVNINDGVVEVLNSLSGGYIEYRSLNTMQSYINGISQKSILVIEYK